MRIIAILKWVNLDQKSWGKVSEHCDKSSQSPIDLYWPTAKNLYQNEFHYENYEQTYSWQGINNGHTIKFTPVGDQLP